MLTMDGVSRTVFVLTCSLLLALQCVEGAAAKTKVARAPGDEIWDYIEVRPGAHMFWWLYYVSDPSVNDVFERPLVIWLQGGPGASSTGYGNFEEIGPLDLFLQPRNSTWVREANIMFIDNPVGTGYSYVERSSQLTTTNKQIALDLVTMIKDFLDQIPEFATVPLYIFSESYGGKMAAEFALELDKSIKAGEIDANLKGVALGDGWLSPVDSTTTWAPFLLQTGIVDTDGFAVIDNTAQKCRKAVEEERWGDATSLWSDTEVDVLIQSHGVDFYNILYKTEPNFVKRLMDSKNKTEFLINMLIDRDQLLKELMQGPIRDKLFQNTPDLANWGAQSGEVFSALSEDFMKPATHIVEELLTNTEIDVVVYTGQLDLIVDTPGTLLWVERLNWPGASQWLASSRDPLVIDTFTEGYVKKYGHLSFWWINRAGHMVPTDNPAAGLKLLRTVTGLE